MAWNRKVPEPQAGSITRSVSGFLDCCATDLCREPVRRVVFAEIVALGRVDERLVKDLENVGFDRREAETTDLTHDATYEIYPCRAR